jgi:hypothetical protein
MTMDQSRHTMYGKSISGVMTLVTRISQGAQTINDDLGKRMAG